MNSLIGYPLKDALIDLEKLNLIIKIIKVEGSNKRFKGLERPCVIRGKYSNDTVTLYVSYF
jgi:hypothetical protein